MDLDAFRWLLTDAGQTLLTRAEELRASGADPLRAPEALRREVGLSGAGLNGTDVDAPGLAAAALTQAELRDRAREKFGEAAARMYFTPDGLEQATRASVAEHRAARLVAASVETTIDLGCGIGGDLVALAAAGITTVGIDLDPLRVEVARANLAALGLGGAVSVADATAVDHTGFDVAFADPARRNARGRTFSIDDWAPPWAFVEGLLRRAACVKVAPGIPHAVIPEGVEAEWVSDRGEVKEAALWSGVLATTRRRATVIAAGGLATLTEADDPGPEGARELGAFLYEPDGAVIRAGLVTAVAAGVGGGLLDEHIAYVTADNAFQTPFARSYRVIEELPYREKPLKAALRARGIGRLTIKKRGVDIVPETLRKRLDPTGDAEGTIVLTRIAGRGACLLVEPF